MRLESQYATPTAKMVFAMILAGSIGLFVVESGQSALVIVFLRCLIGGAALLLYTFIVSPKVFSLLTWRSFFWMSLSGLTMAANWVLFFQAYTHSSISMVTIVYHVYPFALVFASAFLFRERLSRASLAWAFLAFAGVSLIALGGDGGASMTILGLALTMAAMVCYAITLLIAKHLSKVPTELLSVVQLIVGTLVLLPFVGFTGFQVQAESWAYLLVIGIVHTAFMYILLYGAVQSLRTDQVAILSFLYPLTALLFDILVYDVRPDVVQITGLLAIMVAVLGERLKCFGPKQSNFEKIPSINGELSQAPGGILTGHEVSGS